MKNYWISVLGLFLILSCDPDDAPNTKVPSVVLNAFQKEFPRTIEPEWEFREDTFSVDFEISGRETEVVFNKKGRILKTSEEISVEDLPEAVEKTVRAKFDMSEIDEIKRVQKNERQYFVIKIDQFFQEEHFTFSASGEELNKIPVKQ